MIQLQKKPKVRLKSDAFVIEGIKMFEESRIQGNLIKSYFSESFYKKKIKEEPDYFKDILYEIVLDSVLETVSDTLTPQGVLAIVKMPKYNFDDIITKSNTNLLILEDIRDPGNLGTIVRTAEGAGFHGIILSKNSVDIFSPKVIRSTMGAIYRMPFLYVENFHHTLYNLKQRNIILYAAHLLGESNYDDVSYGHRCGIMIGNEGKGLKEETAKIADFYVKIPMEGKVESLNAAVASAILMYEVARQRRKEKGVS